jgi:hypothetical protein
MGAGQFLVFTNELNEKRVLVYLAGYWLAIDCCFHRYGHQ